MDLMVMMIQLATVVDYQVLPITWEELKLPVQYDQPSTWGTFFSDQMTH
jgi:hypothetical protein